MKTRLGNHREFRDMRMQRSGHRAIIYRLTRHFVGKVLLENNVIQANIYRMLARLQNPQP